MVIIVLLNVNLGNVNTLLFLLLPSRLLILRLVNWILALSLVFSLFVIWLSIFILFKVSRLDGVCNNFFLYWDRKMFLLKVKFLLVLVYQVFYFRLRILIWNILVYWKSIFFASRSCSIRTFLFFRLNPIFELLPLFWLIWPLGFVSTDCRVWIWLFSACVVVDEFLFCIVSIFLQIRYKQI